MSIRPPLRLLLAVFLPAVCRPSGEASLPDRLKHLEGKQRRLPVVEPAPQG